jgi:hypothetical protein
MKDGDDFGVGVPAGRVIPDKLKVEDRSGQIPLERQGGNTEHHLHVRQLHRDIDVKGLF